MRLIDADALIDNIPQADLNNDKKISKCGAIVDMVLLVCDAPTIDAVPVVRCRECKSHGTLKSGELFCGKIKTGIYGYYHTVKADDYCSYGAKMEP